MTETDAHLLSASNLLYGVNLTGHFVDYMLSDGDLIRLTPSNYTQGDMPDKQLLHLASTYLLIDKQMRCVFSTFFFREYNSYESNKRFNNTSH